MFYQHSETTFRMYVWEQYGNILKKAECGYTKIVNINNITTLSNNTFTERNMLLLVVVEQRVDLK